MWDLFLRLNGQWRVGFGAVTGIDLGVALQMGRALAIPEIWVAEFIPDMESAALAAMREKEDTADGD